MDTEFSVLVKQLIIKNTYSLFCTVEFGKGGTFSDSAAHALATYCVYLINNSYPPGGGGGRRWEIGGGGEMGGGIFYRQVDKLI